MTHALVLRAGRVVASGPLPAALTSETLSAAYGIDLWLERRDGRFSARGAPRGSAGPETE